MYKMVSKLELPEQTLSIAYIYLLRAIDETFKNPEKLFFFNTQIANR